MPAHKKEGLEQVKEMKKGGQSVYPSLYEGATVNCNELQRVEMVCLATKSFTVTHTSKIVCGTGSAW